MSLALRMGKSLEETMRTVCSTEFLLWEEFLSWEWNKLTRLDYQLARIAQEIIRSRVKNPGAIKVEDCIVKFDLGETKQITPEQIEINRRKSKAFWGAVAKGRFGKGKQPAKQPQRKPTPRAKQRNRT